MISIRRGARPSSEWRTVLALRSEYGKPQKQLSDPIKYYDATYYRKALGN